MENFVNLVLSVWSQGVFGIDLNNILVAIVILLIFVILRSVFSKIVIGRLKVLVKKSKTKIDDAMLEAFDGPLRFFPVVIGVYISTQYLNLNTTLELFAANLNRSLITIQIFLKILDDETTNNMPLNIIEESKKEFDERIIGIDWEKYYNDRPFNPSALSLYKWAPIADELKKFDKQIVLNSVFLKWNNVQKDFKKLVI